MFRTIPRAAFSFIGFLHNCYVKVTDLMQRKEKSHPDMMWCLQSILKWSKWAEISHYDTPFLLYRLNLFRLGDCKDPFPSYFSQESSPWGPCFSHGNGTLLYISVTSSPEMWWMYCPWRHSRSGCTRLWAVWSRCRCCCSLQWSWTRWLLQVPYNS